MELGFGSIIFAFIAGILSTLSPCVIPILPIVIGSALNEHRYGPFVLALGLTVSFAILGTILASFGSALGINAEHFRIFAAVLMLMVGLILVSPALQERFAVATSSIAGSGNSLLSHMQIKGLKGQFFLGLLLGIVWAPCVGPTLGAAVTLASQGKDLAMVVLVMTIFGLGAGIPLAVLGLVSRQGFMKIRGTLGDVVKLGKILMGASLMIMGALILLDLDKSLEAYLVEKSPYWLTNLTTYF